MDCEFCKIIKGELPSSKLYENDTTISFMDIADDVDGHILVIPKKHCKNILDCDSDALHDMMDTVQKVSRHLVDNCGYDGVNLLNASDESAGQTRYSISISTSFRASAMTATADGLFSRAPKRATRTISKN